MSRVRSPASCAISHPPSTSGDCNGFYVTCGWRSMIPRKLISVDLTFSPLRREAWYLGQTMEGVSTLCPELCATMTIRAPHDRTDDGHLSRDIVGMLQRALGCTGKHPLDFLSVHCATTPAEELTVMQRCFDIMMNHSAHSSSIGPFFHVFLLSTERLIGSPMHICCGWGILGANQTLSQSSKLPQN